MTSRRPALGLLLVALIATPLVTAATCSSSPSSTGTASTGTAGGDGSPSVQPTPRPDVVVILTDDQRRDQLWMMPKLRQLVTNHGMKFNQALISNPICCPSRATLLTGRYAHTTGVYANWGTNGPSWFAKQGGEDSNLATWLHGAGYRTGLVGKYFNGYNGDEVPPGWDSWFAMEGQTPKYYDYDVASWSRGKEQVSQIHFGSGAQYYSTTVLSKQAVDFIESTPRADPLFLWLAPSAPHTPSTPAPEDTTAFADTPVHFGPSVNEADVSDKPDYIRSLPKIPQESLVDGTRKAWESLLGVDRMVQDVVEALKERGSLSKTLIVFMSDNGQMNGEHRWGAKQVPYEESIGVPLIVRYDPMIQPGSTTDAVAGNVDIAPTIAQIAGVKPSQVEGKSLVPILSGAKSSVRRSFLLEHMHFSKRRDPPSYCGVRTSDWMFARYDTGESELYNLRTDPFELTNVADEKPKVADRLQTLAESLCEPPPPGYRW